MDRQRWQGFSPRAGFGPIGNRIGNRAGMVPAVEKLIVDRWYVVDQDGEEKVGRYVGEIYAGYETMSPTGSHVFITEDKRLFVAKIERVKRER